MLKYYLQANIFLETSIQLTLVLKMSILFYTTKNATKLNYHFLSGGELPTGSHCTPINLLNDFVLEDSQHTTKNKVRFFLNVTTFLK